MADDVINFVGSGVEHIFPFQKDFGAPEMFCQGFGKVEARGSASVVAQHRCKVGLELRILAGFLVSSS